MFLGIDLGCARLTALVLAADGSVLAEAAAPITTMRPGPGQFEQAPAEWITASEIALGRLAGQTDLGRIRAIGLTGHMQAPVLLGSDDRVLRPCLLQRDRRAGSIAGTDENVDAGIPANKLIWVQQAEPYVWRACAHIAMPKDYLRLWLTGERTTDPSDASETGWLDPATRGWQDDMAGLLPEITAGDAISGSLRDTLADRFGLPAGLPVVGGAGNRAALAIALGAERPGDGWSTPGWLGDAMLLQAREILKERHHCIGNLGYSRVYAPSGQAIAAGLAGFQDAQSVMACLSITACIQPGTVKVILDDAKASGTVLAVLGLNHRTDARGISRAIKEAQAFGLASAFEAIAGNGTGLERLAVAIDPSEDTGMLTILATLLDLEIAVLSEPHRAAAIGAAKLAQLGVEGSTTVPEFVNRIVPAPAMRAAYRDAAASHRQARQLLSGVKAVWADEVSETRAKAAEPFPT